MHDFARVFDKELHDLLLQTYYMQRRKIPVQLLNWMRRWSYLEDRKHRHRHHRHRHHRHRHRHRHRFCLEGSYIDHHFLNQLPLLGIIQVSCLTHLHLPYLQINFFKHCL